MLLPEAGWRQRDEPDHAHHVDGVHLYLARFLPSGGHWGSIAGLGLRNRILREKRHE